MYVSRAFALFTLLTLAFTSLVGAKIETFYFDKQKAYRVDAVVADELLMKEIDVGEVADYEGDRSDAWWVRGELPLDASHAHLFAHYEIANRSNSFKDRGKPLLSDVKLRIPRWLPKRIANEEGWNAFVVVAWHFKGSLSEFHVLDSNKIGRRGGQIEFDIPTSRSGGMPIGWLVKGGVVLEKSNVFIWDKVAFSNEYEVGELAAAKPDGQGKSVAHYAAANGLLDLLAAALGENPKLARAVDKEKYSPIWYAAQNGRAKAVQQLLDAGAPYKDGGYKQSVLSHAARSGQFEVVKVLAPGKVKGRTREAYNWALSQGLSSHSEEIVNYLLERGAKFTAPSGYHGDWVLTLFSRGYPELAFTLMDELKVKPDVQKGGYGLLHSVAAYADVTLLESVAERGPKLDLLTDKGMGAVDYAIGLGNVEAICWFYDNASESLGQPGGIDPLTYAIKEGQLSSVECLYGYGIDVNKDVGPGISPLMYAAFLGKFDIALSILENGGKWYLEGDYIDAIVTKLLARDQRELVVSLIEQGWRSDRLLLGEFTLLEASDFYGADRVVEELKARSWELGTRNILSVKETEVKPALLNALNVKYPETLQKEFGERSIKATLAISASGVPVFVKPKLAPEEEALRSVVENAVLKLRFDPAMTGDEAVPVAITVRVPLAVDFDPSSVLTMADVDEKPKAIRIATPLYPFSMQQLKREGRVVVEFVVLQDGSVRNARVHSSTHSEFEYPAVACVTESIWQPAKRNGYPTACRVRMPIDFKP
ncbi:TonB family protein [Pelagicoccus mobilis]|uniref:TonB family protein n=1 Tax=Pelagicoccus mobilis TaxID=415221 RepID=A0A934RYT3_9BACT|nr:TonB family protein [Pelagicoccus mobilis]MBK1880210.1 TonB family protein [Pelagicoccus mobilis]